MRKRRTCVARRCVIFFVVCGAMSWYAVAPQQKQPGSTIAADLEKKLKDTIAKARQKVLALKDLVKEETFRTKLNALSYDVSTKLDFLTKEGDGLTLDWGYAGHGAISEGFKGFSVTPVIKDVPTFLENAVREALAKAGLQDLVTFTPAQEWLFKVMLLASDFVNKKVSGEEFALEINLLTLKLLNTKDKKGAKRYATFQSVVDDIAPFIKKVLAKIPLKLSEEALLEGKVTTTGKDVVGFFNTFYAKLSAIAARQFSKTVVAGKLVEEKGYKPDTSKLTDAQGRELLLGIICKTVTFYTDFKNAFEKTDAGKKAAATLKQALESAQKITARAERLKARVKAIKDYNKGLSGFSDLVTFIGLELARLLGRLQNTKYRDTIAKVFDPVLGLVGLPSFADLVAGFREEAPLEKEPPPPPKKTIEEQKREEELLKEEFKEGPPEGPEEEEW